MKTHAELKDELLRDPEVRREYERLGPEFELIRSLVAAGSSAPDRLCAQAGLEDAGQAIGGEDKKPQQLQRKALQKAQVASWLRRSWLDDRLKNAELFCAISYARIADGLAARPRRRAGPRDAGACSGRFRR